MAKRKVTKSDLNKAKKAYGKLSTTGKIIVAMILILAILCVGLYFLWDKYKDRFTPITGDIAFHFLELGNNYNGDCIYIQAGDTDIIVDGGSRTDSVKTITKYINRYVPDKTIEYAIITHADQDHIAGWSGKDNAHSLFDEYEVETIIDFPRTDKTTKTYNAYVESRAEEVANGAKHYTALECYNNENGAKRVYELADGIELEILYNYYYEHTASEENDYSVCFMINQGSKHYLFTGDLEEGGEAKLVENNDLPKCTLYKAGHHGSYTASSLELLQTIQPEYIVVSCVAGSVEYTQNLENTFPAQVTIDRIAQYTNKVYVTSAINVEYANGSYSNKGNKYSLNGNVVVVSNAGDISVECSGSSDVLKDSAWFKANRNMPTSWQVA